jgi:histidinol-phosphate phosphatase family protein
VNKGRSFVFVDRDGVINRNIDGDYVRNWSQFEFLPGAKEALARLAKANWGVAVVSNQGCINKGLVGVDVLEDIHRRMNANIVQAGGWIDGIYICPHRNEENCDCRKPKPGLLVRAAKELGIDPAGAWLVGDAAADIAAGRTFGCRTILVLSGRTAPADAKKAGADRTASDLAEAVKIILGETRT